MLDEFFACFELKYFVGVGAFGLLLLVEVAENVFARVEEELCSIIGLDG